MGRILCAFAAITFAVAASTGSAVGDCHLRGGQHVVLFGNTDDPDVFVWDSRDRLNSYQAGSWGVGQALLPHAIVAHPGTRAIVLSCIPNFVHPKFRFALDDAVGVVIVQGRYRGRIGWVMASDVQAAQRKRSNGTAAR